VSRKGKYEEKNWPITKHKNGTPIPHAKNVNILSAKYSPRFLTFIHIAYHNCLSFSTIIQQRISKYQLKLSPQLPIQRRRTVTQTGRSKGNGLAPLWNAERQGGGFEIRCFKTAVWCMF